MTNRKRSHDGEARPLGPARLLGRRRPGEAMDRLREADAAPSRARATPTIVRRTKNGTFSHAAFLGIGTVTQGYSARRPEHQQEEQDEGDRHEGDRRRRDPAEPGRPPRLGQLEDPGDGRAGGRQPRPEQEVHQEDRPGVRAGSGGQGRPRSSSAPSATRIPSTRPDFPFVPSPEPVAATVIPSSPGRAGGSRCPTGR